MCLEQAPVRRCQHSTSSDIVQIWRWPVCRSVWSALQRPVNEECDISKKRGLTHYIPHQHPHFTYLTVDIRICILSMARHLHICIIPVAPVGRLHWLAVVRLGLAYLLPRSVFSVCNCWIWLFFVHVAQMETSYACPYEQKSLAEICLMSMQRSC